jgi:hypothetical protein
MNAAVLPKGCVVVPEPGPVNDRRVWVEVLFKFPKPNRRRVVFAVPIRQACDLVSEVLSFYKQTPNAAPQVLLSDEPLDLENLRPEQASRVRTWQDLEGIEDQGIWRELRSAAKPRRGDRG